MDTVSFLAAAIVGVTLILAALCWLIMTHMMAQLLRVNDSHLETTRELATANRAMAESLVARLHGAVQRSTEIMPLAREYSQPTESSLTPANGSAREWQ